MKGKGKETTTQSDSDLVPKPIVTTTANNALSVNAPGYASPEAPIAPAAGSDQTQSTSQNESQISQSPSGQNLNLSSIYAGTFATNDFPGYTSLDYNRLASLSYLSDTKNTITYENMNYQFTQNNGMLMNYAGSNEVLGVTSPGVAPAGNNYFGINALTGDTVFSSLTPNKMLVTADTNGVALTGFMNNSNTHYAYNQDFVPSTTPKLETLQPANYDVPQSIVKSQIGVLESNNIEVQEPKVQAFDANGQISQSFTNPMGKNYNLADITNQAMTNTYAQIMQRADTTVSANMVAAANSGKFDAQSLVAQSLMGNSGSAGGGAFGFGNLRPNTQQALTNVQNAFGNALSTMLGQPRDINAPVTTALNQNPLTVIAALVQRNDPNAAIKDANFNNLLATNVKNQNNLNNLQNALNNDCVGVKITLPNGKDNCNLPQNTTDRIVTVDNVKALGINIENNKIEIDFGLFQSKDNLHQAAQLLIAQKQGKEIDLSLLDEKTKMSIKLLERSSEAELKALLKLLNQQVKFVDWFNEVEKTKKSFSDKKNTYIPRMPEAYHINDKLMFMVTKLIAANSIRANEVGHKTTKDTRLMINQLMHSKLGSRLIAELSKMYQVTDFKMRKTLAFINRNLETILSLNMSKGIVEPNGKMQIKDKSNQFVFAQLLDQKLYNSALFTNNFFTSNDKVDSQPMSFIKTMQLTMSLIMQGFLAGKGKEILTEESNEAISDESQIEQEEFPNLKDFIEKFMAQEENTLFDENETEEDRQARLERERKYLDEINADFFNLPAILELEEEAKYETYTEISKEDEENNIYLPKYHVITPSDIAAIDGLREISNSYYGRYDCAQAIVKFNAESSKLERLIKEPSEENNPVFIIGNFKIGQKILLPPRKYAMASVGNPKFFLYDYPKRKRLITSKDAIQA